MNQNRRRTGSKGLFVILGIVIVVGLYFISTQRGLVDQRESVESSWSDIQIQYQRRADLIPNIVATVKEQANREQEIFTAIADARAKLGGASTREEIIAANQEVANSLSRLLVVVENYPELKQDQAFQDLRVQLEGTENRIAVARKNYNDAARSYKSRIKMFPTNLVAGILGYTDEYPYIEAEPGAEKAPEVSFD
ncbi:MAG: LemA family protein [Epulopiscium sp.]|nr:LemA family protein [Candidatus Epulonipiscium sp.]